MCNPQLSADLENKTELYSLYVKGNMQQGANAMPLIVMKRLYERGQSVGPLVDWLVSQ